MVGRGIGILPGDTLLLILTFASNDCIRVVCCHSQVAIQLGRASLPATAFAFRALMYDTWAADWADLDLRSVNGFDFSDDVMKSMRTYLSELFIECTFQNINHSHRMFMDLYDLVAARHSGALCVVSSRRHRQAWLDKFFRWSTYFHFVMHRLESMNSDCLQDMSILTLTILFIVTKFDAQENFFNAYLCGKWLPAFNKVVYKYHNDFIDVESVKKSIRDLERKVLCATDYRVPRIDCGVVLSTIFERIDILSSRSHSNDLLQAKLYARHTMWGIVRMGKVPGWEVTKRCVREAMCLNETLVKMEGLVRIAINETSFLFLKI